MDGGDESCPSRASRGGLNFGPERPNTPAQCQHLLDCIEAHKDSCWASMGFFGLVIGNLG